ncbi:hypothetical protein [Planctopirus hydrillae]|nr:hypothetical protein [Planctopirus hydrillae]
MPTTFYEFAHGLTIGLKLDGSWPQRLIVFLLQRYSTTRYDNLRADL